MSPPLVEAYLARSGMFTPGVADPRRYDEMTGTNGSLLPGWSDLARELDAIGGAGLSGLTGRVERLLEDDGVTYTPVAGLTGDPQAGPADPERWRLDPLPLVVEDAEWARLEAGRIQRSTLLDAVLTDIYGDNKLIDNSLLPPDVVYAHPDYLRPAHGITIPGAHQLFFHAVDICRGPTGEFLALGDRTQAPSGAGYAMADRRVISRVLPDLFHRSAPRGLGAYFHTMRSALASVAPNEAEDPRIVVLTPGTHSETAFDQAMLASLLGVPLVENADLTIRRGRLWMRSMGHFEPVDVVVRRVDANWSDPLDLKPGSRLGVVGLAEACRRGTVTVVNTLGSG
ncbi:MAG: circularly permuted type 2 ATP-grasp protein, partial [Nakamurella sp.]